MTIYYHFFKEGKKPQNFKNICSMTLFNKDVGF